LSTFTLGGATPMRKPSPASFTSVLTQQLPGPLAQALAVQV
jgi:hypothetical protein